MFSLESHAILLRVITVFIVEIVICSFAIVNIGLDYWQYFSHRLLQYHRFLRLFSLSSISNFPLPLSLSNVLLL